MAEQRAAGGLDFEALRRAIEQSDAESLARFYADDTGGARRQDRAAGERGGLGRVSWLGLDGHQHDPDDHHLDLLRLFGQSR